MNKSVKLGNRQEIPVKAKKSDIYWVPPIHVALCWASYICHHSSDSDAVEFIFHILSMNKVIQAQKD